MKRPRYIALGLMSGTSVDGVDAAFIDTDGEKIFEFGPRLMHPFSKSDRDMIVSATNAARRWKFHGPKPNSFTAAEGVIHSAHIKAVKSICKQNQDWAQRLTCIGFHGQTVLHEPPKGAKRGRTCQLGDGQILADAFDVPVYFDFRTADIEAGGQGAPLAPVYHKALVERSKFECPTAVLNIGGVGNVTLVKPDGVFMASDTGPGNGPLDSWMDQNRMGNFDPDGIYARKGTPNFHVIKQWLDWGFFREVTPRSADRYAFDVINDLENVSLEDGAATLAAFTALSAVYTLKDMEVGMPKSIIVCGGGRHNKAMLWMMAEHTDAKVKTAESVGWDSDAIEAQAFAYLAVRSRWSLPISFPMTTGVPKPMTGGRVAYPSSNAGSLGGQ